MEQHQKPLEVFTALDLEMNQPSGKIIQIGAVVGNINTGDIFEKLCLNINPHEQLAGFITELTKISQEDVNHGWSLLDAYKELKRIHLYYQSFLNPITWGGGDSQELLTQLKTEGFHPGEEGEGWCFGRRWIDAKTIWVSHRIAKGLQIQGGLAKSMTKVGLKFEGQKHNACDDAFNTFRMYREMLKLLRKP